jgi:hypothetical protein
MDRSNHYEAAFEAYLQWHRHCYVAVDESRRAMLGEVRVKNLDFIVYGEAGARLLVDVKGRRFPGGPANKPRRVWECWSTQDDIWGLNQWTRLFGPGYQGILLFMYDLQETVLIDEDTEDLWTWQGRRYLLRAVASAAYAENMKVRSPKWGTVTLPGPVFRNLAMPFQTFANGYCRVADASLFKPLYQGTAGAASVSLN